MLKKFWRNLTQSLSLPTHDPLQPLALPELIKLHQAAAQINLESRKLVATSLSGSKLAKLRGRGMDFDESRVYQAGDDVRLIDWRVTARTGTTHTKIYREERERPVYCMVDMSTSMWFGTRNTFKAVIAAQAASLIAWAASEHGDRVGAVVYAADQIHALKPAAGKRGVLKLLHLLAQQQLPAENAAYKNLFTDALLQLRHVAKPGSLIFVFTDAMHLDETAQQHLARLSQHCDLIFNFIYDPLEAQLPADGIYAFSDGQQKITLDAGDQKISADYEKLFTARWQQVKTMADRYAMPLFKLATNEAPINTLKNIFSSKKHGK